MNYSNLYFPPNNHESPLVYFYFECFGYQPRIHWCLLPSVGDSQIVVDSNLVNVTHTRGTCENSDRAWANKQVHQSGQSKEQLKVWSFLGNSSQMPSNWQDSYCQYFLEYLMEPIHSWSKPSSAKYTVQRWIAFDWISNKGSDFCACAIMASHLHPTKSPLWLQQVPSYCPLAIVCSCSIHSLAASMLDPGAVAAEIHHPRPKSL